MRDFFRFLFVVVAILMGLFVAWFGLYSLSETNTIRPQPTETVSRLLKITPLRIPHEALTSPSSPSVFLQTHYDPTAQQWRLSLYGPESPELKAALLPHSTKNIFLEILSDDPKALAELKNLLDEDRLWSRIIFLSNSDQLLKDMRDIAPRWSFSTGEVFLTRFLTLSSISLQGLMEVPGDVIYVPNRRKLHEDEIIKLTHFASQRGTFVVFDTLHSWVPESRYSAKIMAPK